MRLMAELAEIDAAITRIQRGTYGICELTGEVISEARLEAIPTARFGLDGQSKHEKLLQRQAVVSARSEKLDGHRRPDIL